MSLEATSEVPKAIPTAIEVPTQVEPASPPVDVAGTPKTLEEYAKAIRDAHQNVEEFDRLSKKKGREAVAEAAKAGQYLIEVKPLVGHGNWQKWLKDNCKIHIRTAQRYMNAARVKNDNQSLFNQFTHLHQLLVYTRDIPPGPQDRPSENQDKKGDNNEAPKTYEIILAAMQRGFEDLQHQYDILTKIDPELERELWDMAEQRSEDIVPLVLRVLLQKWQHPLNDAFKHFKLQPAQEVCPRCGHIRQPDEYFCPILYHVPQYKHLYLWCDDCVRRDYVKVLPFKDVPKAIQALVDNLNELKSLPVKDYTLAQKIDQLKHTTVAKPKFITAAENNVWAPADINNEEQTVAAIQRLLPKIVIVRDEATKKLWDIYRHFVSSAVYYPTPGRWIKFLVVDDSQPSKPVLGIGAISGDFPALAKRDEFIGWTKEQRDKKEKEGGKLGHTAVASTIVPTQIFGPNFNGGKLIASLTTSQPIRDEWQSRYKNVLVGMTTTSLFGVPSMYDRLREWKRLGVTTGRVPVQPKLDIYRQWIEFVKITRTYEFNQMMKQDDDVSGPVTNYKTKVLTLIYKAAGLNPADFMHGHERGIYFSVFYENTCDFLCDRIKESELKIKPLFEETVEQITDRWRKNAIKRYQKLKQEGKLKPEKQSYSQLGKMDFETARQVFLNDETGGDDIEN